MYGSQAERLRAALAERGDRKAKNVFRDTIYDTISVAQAAAMPALLTFFTTPVGTGGKTEAQTNLYMPGQLSNNDIVLVTGIRTQFLFNVNPIDAANLMSLCWLEVVFKTKRFMIGTADTFPAGSAGQVTAATNLGTALAVAGLGPVTSFTNGVPSVHNFFSVGEDGYLIEKNDSFRLNWYTATAFNLLATAVGGMGVTIKVIYDVIRAQDEA